MIRIVFITVRVRNQIKHGMMDYNIGVLSDNERSSSCGFPAFQVRVHKMSKQWYSFITFIFQDPSNAIKIKKIENLK